MPECVECHPGAKTSKKPGDNLLPAQEVCLKCHHAVVPAPVVVRVVHFSHATHARVGNVASVIAAAIDAGKYLEPPGGLRKALDTRNPCLGCHRGIETSEKVTRANLPRMADCLVCHAEISPPDSCTKCHGDDAALKPASHTADFIDTHTSSAAVGKTGCAVCHGRTFTCQGCH